MPEEIMRVSAKGQLTIPVAIRKMFDIHEGDYLGIRVENGEICMRKVKTIEPLSQEDPIWKLIGAGESGYADVSENHDQFLVQEETKRWKK